MRGWLVVLVFVALVVFGVLLVAESGGPDDYLGIALLVAAVYVPWWAAVARAGDSWSPWRRGVASGLSAVLAGLACGGAVVSVVDAVAILADDTFGFVAFAVLGFPLAIVLWARHFWAVLARDAPPLAHERHLLLAITLSAVLAFVVDLLAGNAAASSGEMLAGLLSAMMAVVAGSIALVMVVPWIVWAVRSRRTARP